MPIIIVINITIITMQFSFAKLQFAGEGTTIQSFSRE